MQKHSKILLVIACIYAASSIILASLGAHLAADFLSIKQLTDTFNKAVEYSQFNALALIGIAVLCQVCAHGRIKNRYHWAGYCIAVGGFVFQTSLFLYTLADMAWLTSVTPLGGILMISGWVFLAILALFSHSH